MKFVNMKAEEYLAHSENVKDESQTMREHSLQVAHIMKQFALSKEYVDLYEYCGYIHDMGKYSDEFQQYITDGGPKTKHSIYGAILAFNNKCIEIALPVYGHHAGIPNCDEMLTQIKAEFNCEKEKYNNIYKRWFNDVGRQISLPSNESFIRLSNVLSQELFVRMLYSSLIDADSLDTEKHFDEGKFNSRMSPTFDSQLLLCKLQRTLDSFTVNSENIGINKLRNGG